MIRSLPRIASILIIILFFSPDLFSQAGIAGSNQQKNDSISVHSLFASTGYGSNMVYLGSTISQDLPFGFVSVTYGFRERLYFSYSAVHISSRNPFAAFSTASLTYNQTFNSWFDASAGIYGYLVAPSLTDTLFNNFVYGNLTLGFDWKILYTQITAGSIFNVRQRAYFQIRNSRYFQTRDFKSGKFNFSFDPYFNLMAGPLTKQELTGSSVIIISPPFKKKGKSNSSSSSSSTKYTTSYGLMELDFGIPVTFNANRFSVEAEPGYILPFYDNEGYPGTRGFIFTLTASLRIL